MPREYTPEEVRDQLLQLIWSRVTYWETLPMKTVRERLEGLGFSILTALDGATELPAFSIVPSPHESDKEYNQEKGQNWYPSEGDIGPLHEFYFKHRPVPPKSEEEESALKAAINVLKREPTRWFNVGEIVFQIDLEQPLCLATWDRLKLMKFLYQELLLMGPQGGVLSKDCTAANFHTYLFKAKV